MDIVDLHAHTYPTPEIWRLAIQDEGWSPYLGTPAELHDAMTRGGITSAATANFTPVADMRDAALARRPAGLTDAERAEVDVRLRETLRDHVIRRNRWTLETAPADPGLVPFVGLDPSVMSPGELRDELEACIEAGARGLKLHPIIQRLPPEAPALWPVYELCCEHGLAVLFHSGTLGRSEWNAFARPAAFAPVLEAFPDLAVVLAHLGRGHYDEVAALAERFPGVCFDTCGTVTTAPVPWRLDDETAVALIRRLGVERVCFGSDYPWFDPAADAAHVAGLPDLSTGERAAILGENARRLLDATG